MGNLLTQLEPSSSSSSYPTTLATNGLILHLEPFNKSCFSQNVGETTLRNLVNPNSSVATLTSSVPNTKFTYNPSQGSISVRNDMNLTSGVVLPPLANVKTFTVWLQINSENSDKLYRHLISAPGDWNWRIFGSPRFDLDNTEISGWQGAFWFGGNSGQNQYYYDGVDLKRSFWTSIENPQKVWKCLTFYVGNPSASPIQFVLFANALDGVKSYNLREGLNCSFGPVLMYDRYLDETEIKQNYRYYVEMFAAMAPSLPTTPPDEQPIMIYNSSSTFDLTSSSVVTSNPSTTMLVDLINGDGSSMQSSPSFSSTVDSSKSKGWLMIILPGVIVIGVAVFGFTFLLWKDSKDSKKDKK